MKFTILLAILFDLLSKRKLTARYCAEKYAISERTVYRYIDHLALSVPVYIKRGRNGGIYLSDDYTLPTGFMTKEEYDATMDALSYAYARSPEPRFLHVKHKLSEHTRKQHLDLALTNDLQTFITDGGSFAHTQALFEKLRLICECIQNKAILEMQYFSELDGQITCKIEPHVLLHKRNVFYVYAFSRFDRRFKLYRLTRILSMIKTGDRFVTRAVKREEIPLSFFSDENSCINVRLRIERRVLQRMQDLLGATNIKKIDGEWQAEIILPNDEFLLTNLLSLGDGVTVIEPLSVKENIIALVKCIRKAYE